MYYVCSNIVDGFKQYDMLSVIILKFFGNKTLYLSIKVVLSWKMIVIVGDYQCFTDIDNQLHY